jgi:hypothetical protein
VAFFPHPRTLYRAFACDDHAGQLDVARPLDDAGRAHLEHRREQRRLVIAEHQPYEPEPPLATGADALAMLKRAHAWAATRPDCRP